METSPRKRKTENRREKGRNRQDQKGRRDWWMSPSLGKPGATGRGHGSYGYSSKRPAKGDESGGGDHMGKSLARSDHLQGEAEISSAREGTPLRSSGLKEYKRWELDLQKGTERAEMGKNFKRKKMSAEDQRKGKNDQTPTQRGGRGNQGGGGLKRPLQEFARHELRRRGWKVTT